MATLGPRRTPAPRPALQPYKKATSTALMRSPYRQRVGRPLATEVPTLPDTAEGRLAGRVRQIRVERGWSQAELAKRMSDLVPGWHQTTVAKTERAERDLRYPELLALAEALAIPLQALLDPTSVSDPDEESRLTIHRLEQEQQLLTLRVAFLDNDIDDMETQRKAHLQHLSELKKKITAARRAYKATGT